MIPLYTHPAAYFPAFLISLEERISVFLLQDNGSGLARFSVSWLLLELFFFIRVFCQVVI